MKNILILLVVVLAIFSATSWMGGRKARAAVEIWQKDYATVSNKLAQAETQISEKNAAIETLKVQQGLTVGDLATLSNRIAQVQGIIGEEREKVAAGLRSAQELRGEVAKAGKAAEVAAQLEQELRDTIKALERDLGAMRKTLETARLGAEELQAKLSSSESARRELLQRWSDPAAVRAQHRLYSQVPPMPAGNPAPNRKAKLVLKEDGTVQQAVR